MSLSKTLYLLLSTCSTQEDPSRHDWDVKDQIKQTNYMCRSMNVIGFNKNIGSNNIFEEHGGSMVECLTQD